jgi:hypothetical protein
MITLPLLTTKDKDKDKDRNNLICNFLLTNYMTNSIIGDGNVHALFIGVLY